MMIRKQIQLTERQAALVRRAARRRGISEAALIRELVERGVREGETSESDPLLSLIGKFRSKGRRDTSREHDRYLADAFRT